MKKYEPRHLTAEYAEGAENGLRPVRRRAFLRALRALCGLFLAVRSAFSTPPLERLDWNPRLGRQLPDVALRDEAGRTLRLGSLFRGRPVVLAFAYYGCPTLCPLALNGMVRAFRALSFTAGREFDALVVSIDPRETPPLAASRRAVLMASYGRAGADWRFLTGGGAELARLADAAGFRYALDPASGRYAHPAGLVVLTPDRRPARYLYGVEYSARDLRLALIEAAAGRIGGAADKVLLYCLDYDPASGRYGAAALRLVRLAGAATMLGLAALVVWLERSGGRR